MATMKQQPHVAMLAFPFGSHASVLLSVACKLAASAPNVAFSYFSTAKSNASLTLNIPSSSSLDNLKLYNVFDGVPDNHVFTGKPEEDVEMFLKATPGNFEKCLEVAVAERGGAKVSCVISDSFLGFAGEMAEQMGGVPWISFWAAAPCSLSVHFHTDLIRTTIGVGPAAIKAGVENQDLSFIPGLSHMRVADLPEGIVFGDLHSMFSCLLHQTGRATPRATAVVMNTFEKLDDTTLNYLNTKFHKCLSVGPLNLTAPQQCCSDQYGCISWLDSHKPATVAYISFGTVASPPLNELASLAAALEASGGPFLWSLKEQLKGNLPRGFLNRTQERGLVVSWAPQPLVLEHVAVGAFVTHCGWNSVLESICAGVPMIGRPFFGDHRLIGRLISEVWGIGICVEGGKFSTEGVLTALNVVLNKEEGKMMRSRVGVLGEQAGHAASPHGSSSKNYSALLNIVSSG